MQFTGLPHQTKVFDAAGTLFSDNKTFFSRYTKVLDDLYGNKVGMGYYVRQYKAIALFNGVETITTQSFDVNTGLVTYSTAAINNGQPVPNEIRMEYKYFWQQYDYNREKNILTPVIQTKKIITKSIPVATSKVVGMSATTWKEWNGVYAPHKSYQWLRSGSDTDFDFAAAAEANEPTSVNWRKVSEIDKLDAKGNVLQVTSF